VGVPSQVMAVSFLGLACMLGIGVALAVLFFKWFLDFTNREYKE